MATTTEIGSVESGQRSAIEAEILGRILENWESCSSLWIAVIERAAEDLQWLRRMSERRTLRKHEMERLKKVLEHNPAEFFRGPWFRDICDHMNVSADDIRARYGVDELLAAS